MWSRFAAALAVVLALAPAANATLVMDFNYPTSGTFSPGNDCTSVTGVDSSYVEDGILAQSCFPPDIRTLLSEYTTGLNVSLYGSPPPLPPGLWTGQYFAQEGFTLEAGGYFNVVSFELYGCGGTLTAYAGGIALVGVGTSVCELGLTPYDVLDQPGWTDVNALVFSADGSFVTNSMEIFDLVLDPLSSPAPEPASLALLGLGLAGLGFSRRKQ